MLLRLTTIAAVGALVVCSPSILGGPRSACAQDATATESDESSLTGVEGTEEEPPAVLSYIAPKSFDMVLGLKVTAGNGPMVGTVATTVFPTAWPEQDIEILETNVPAFFKADFRDLPGNNKQLVLFSRTIPANAIAEATIKVRITKRHTIGPEDPSELVVPRRVSRDAKQFLGDSPYIKTGLSELRAVIREVDASEPETQWERIEMFYDWVRDNIRYENGELKTLQQALRDKAGDCEEMTSAFIALCRTARIPARCVWIPNHCYPEFYMEDAEGNGHWFPCQAAGTRNFGSMPEYLPILQKGDRFTLPEKPGERQRYIADFLSAKRVSGTKDPKVEFVRQLLGEAANFRVPDADAVIP